MKKLLVIFPVVAALYMLWHYRFFSKSWLAREIVDQFIRNGEEYTPNAYSESVKSVQDGQTIWEMRKYLTELKKQKSETS